MNTYKRLSAITKENTFTIIEAGEGSNKLSADFRYIFEGRISIGDTFFLGVPDSEQACSDSIIPGRGPYICCTYDRKSAKKRLDAAGLKYQKDYYFAEDLFCLLDDMKNSRIAFLSYDGSLKGWLKSIIFGYAAKHGKKLPEKFSSAAFFYLIFGFPGMLCQMVSKGNLYKNYDHICFCNAVDAVRFKKDHPNASDKVITLEGLQAHTMAPLYMREVYFDKRQYSCKCERPFNTLWIGREGTTRICDCPDFLDISLGNMGITGAEDLWRSPLAGIIRLSVINNSYTFCSERLCTMLSAGKAPASAQERRNIKVSGHPANISFACDHSCNLHCPSCRKEICAKNDGAEDMLIKSCIDDLTDLGWLDTSEELVVGGGGETFLSDNYKKVLCDTDVKRKKAVIMTNGNLFNRREWEHIEGKYEHVSFLVSVDAVTKETYDKVRCGGNFDRLMENMNFLSELRRENKVDKVSVILVVQRANYREIPDFIRWAGEKGFDCVSLSLIRNWGTFEEKDFFENYAMTGRDGKIRPELAAVLEDPICKDGIVNMGFEVG